jgi:uncharacterized membrane protein
MRRIVNKSSKGLYLDKKKLKTQQSKSAVKKPFLSPVWQLMLFIIGVVLIYCVLFTTVFQTPYSAMGVFLRYASLVMQGQVPYVDFNLEYPPLALLFFLLPRLVSSSLLIYTVLFKAEVLLAILVGLFLIYLLARRLGKAPWKMTLVYTLCILAVGPIIAVQFDIFSAILTLSSLYAFILGKSKTAWALLALGALTKIYPLFLAPVYLVIALRSRHYRAAGTGILTALVTCLVLAGPFIIAGSDSIKSLVEYHLQRGIQLESTYSSILLIADKLGLTRVALDFSFGSWNLAGAAADALTKLSSYLLIVLLLIAYWFIYRQTKPGKSQSTRLGAYALLVLSIVLITSKVFSPQYLIWLIPLFPLVLQRERFIILGVFILTGLSTYYLFPHAYLDLINLSAVPVFVLFIRNLLLVLLTVLMVVSLHRMKASE